MVIYSCSKCNKWSESQDNCCGEVMDNFSTSTVVAILNAHTEIKRNNKPIVIEEVTQYCNDCNEDITVNGTVERTYYNKDNGNMVVATGHIDEHGDFITDNKLDTTRLDLFDDPDTCTNCDSEDLITK